MLECFKTTPEPPRLVPGRLDRSWMDGFSKRFPYNCLPLNVANTSGWELLCPFGFSATYDGGLGVEAITVIPDVEREHPEYFVASHFSHGTLTFNLGYLFRTPPGYDTLVTGAPNHFKHGLQPMSGVIETHWLPYPFTMNWLFTAPGTVRFEKDEPFCFIRVVEHRQMEEVQPVIHELSSDPDLAERHLAWLRAREESQPEQHRCYLRGRPPPGGGPEPEDHITKRRLKCPVVGEHS